MQDSESHIIINVIVDIGFRVSMHRAPVSELICLRKRHCSIESLFHYPLHPANMPGKPHIVPEFAQIPAHRADICSVELDAVHFGGHNGPRPTLQDRAGGAQRPDSGHAPRTFRELAGGLHHGGTHGPAGNIEPPQGLQAGPPNRPLIRRPPVPGYRRFVGPDPHPVWREDATDEAPLVASSYIHLMSSKRPLTGRLKLRCVRRKFEEERLNKTNLQGVQSKRTQLGALTNDVTARHEGVVSAIDSYRMNRVASLAGAPMDKGAGVDLLKSAKTSTRIL